MTDDDRPRADRRRSVPVFLRHAYIAVLALWVLMPVALAGRVAQDAIPYIAAGNLARSHPDDVYAARNGDLFDLPATFREEWCRIAPPDADCDDLAVAFVAAPPVIPIAVGLAAPGDRLGPLLMQFAAAGMLAAGMWVLWLRLAHRTRHAPRMLVGAALLLTPMAMSPIGLGQTSPILFLSVCLGLRPLTGRDDGHRGVTSRSFVWAAAAALKVFPAMLVVLLAWRRRRRMMGRTAVILGCLSVATLVVVPVSVWGDFVRSTLELNAHTTTNPYNGAVNAFVIRLVGGSDSTALALAARAVALAAGAAVCWFGMRDTDDDTRWAAGYVALLIITPLVWWHYVWVVIGALGIVLASQKRLTDRLLAVFPVAAAISVAPSIPNTNGRSWPVVQGAVVLIGAGVFCVLARRSVTRTDRRPVSSS